VSNLSRLLLIITNLVTAVSGLLCVTIAIYFIGVAGSVDGGADKWLVTSIVTVTFVVSLAALALGTYNFYRNPNYQVTLRLDPKLTFWVAAPVAFFALLEVCYFASGALIGALIGALAFAGLTVPEAVIAVLLWLLMGTGMIAAAVFLRQVWRRFNALPD
jgi:hypothetical protein